MMMDNLLLQGLSLRPRSMRIVISCADRFMAGLFCHASHIPGLEVATISDVDNQYSLKALLYAGYEMDSYHLRVDGVQQMQKALQAGKVASVKILASSPGWTSTCWWKQAA